MQPLENAGAIFQGYSMKIEEAIQARFHSILDKPEDVLAAMPKKTRKLIKEAEKRHLQIVSGRHELLDDFAAMVEMTEERKHVSLRNKEYFKSFSIITAMTRLSC
ncbi:aminoacyltransferase [Allobaculum sp. Allo2]|nr:aminoacyltransferase [Allobaculum sp. Allo2]